MPQQDIAALAKEIVHLAGQSAAPPPPPPIEKFGTARNVAVIIAATVTVLGLIGTGINFWIETKLAPTNVQVKEIRQHVQNCCSTRHLPPP